MPIFLDGVEDEVFVKSLHVHKLRSLFSCSMNDVFIINAQNCHVLKYSIHIYIFIT